MKIYDFCKTFDFTFETGEFFDDDGEKYLYRASDDQNCFHDRLENDVENFIDDFDSMVPDYIDDDLEYNGFIYDDKSPEAYYTQAYKWISGQPDYNDTWLYEIVSVFSGHDTLTL